MTTPATTVVSTRVHSVSASTDKKSVEKRAVSIKTTNMFKPTKTYTPGKNECTCPLCPKCVEKPGHDEPLKCNGSCPGCAKLFAAGLDNSYKAPDGVVHKGCSTCLHVRNWKVKKTCRTCYNPNCTPRRAYDANDPPHMPWEIFGWLTTGKGLGKIRGFRIVPEATFEGMDPERLRNMMNPFQGCT